MTYMSALTVTICVCPQGGGSSLWISHSPLKQRHKNLIRWNHLYSNIGCSTSRWRNASRSTFCILLHKSSPNSSGLWAEAAGGPVCLWAMVCLLLDKWDESLCLTAEHITSPFRASVLWVHLSDRTDPSSNLFEDWPRWYSRSDALWL